MTTLGGVRRMATPASWTPRWVILLVSQVVLVAVCATKGADTNACQATLQGNGAMTKEVIWQGQSRKQVINYTFEVFFTLPLQFLDVQGDVIRYAITGCEGHIRFWGSAEEVVASNVVDGFSFDIERQYAQSADCGLLYYSCSQKQVVYADFVVETMTGIRPYRVQYLGYAHPHSIRLWIDNFDSHWVFDDVYDGCSIPVGADFTDSKILLCGNGTRITHSPNFVYNTVYGSSWRMAGPDAYVQISFPLDTAPESASLVVRHLSSAYAGCPGGGYSPIDISVNGQLVEQQYDAAENHSGSHSYVTDEWQIGQYLRAGANNVRIARCDNACTHYWISNLDVYAQQSQLDCATCALPGQSDLAVDLAADINNDGTIDASDDEIEELGLGEIVRIDDCDDPFGEDDLQEVSVTVSHPDLSDGLVWITYDSEKVKVWKDREKTERVNPAEALFRLGDDVEVPDRLFVEGVGLTEEGAGTALTVHLAVADCCLGDTLLLTVTGEIGHFAYFAGVRDYLAENQFKVFVDEFEAPKRSGIEIDFRITAVKSETSELEVHDAEAAEHKSIRDVVTHALATGRGTRIILNGTFFVDGGPNTGQAIARAINNYGELDISTPMTSDGPGGWLITYRSWFGQQGNGAWVLGSPGSDSSVPSEPVLPSPLCQDTDLRAAIGGLIALYPEYPQKTVQEIVSQSAVPYGWDHRPSNYVGFDADQKILFAVTTKGAILQWWPLPIDLTEMIANLGKSGADVTLYGLDGGTSIALAHTDRRGDNLRIREAAQRHSGFGAPVSNYLIINESTESQSDDIKRF